MELDMGEIVVRLRQAADLVNHAKLILGELISETQPGIDVIKERQAWMNSQLASAILRGKLNACADRIDERIKQHGQDAFGQSEGEKDAGAGVHGKTGV